MGKNLLLWLIIAAVLLTVFQNFSVEPKQDPMSYSDFVKAVNNGQIREVAIQGDKIYAQDKADNLYVVIWSKNDQKLQDELISNNVDVKFEEPERQSILTQILIASFQF